MHNIKLKTSNTFKNLKINNLIEKAEKYYLLFETSIDALMVIDAETFLFEEANQAALMLYGYSKDEFLTLKVHDISYEKEKTRYLANKYLTMNKKSIRIPVRYFQKKDGSIFAGELTAGIFYSHGRKKIIAAVRDITKRTKIEKNFKDLQKNLEKLVEERTSSLKKTNEKLSIEIEERKNAEKAIKAIEARHHKIIDSITDYIFRVKIKDRKSVTTIHHPACTSITGYSPEDFEKDPYLWIQMVPEEDRKAVKNQITNILSEKNFQFIEHRIIRKDGKIRWVRNKPVPFFDEDGNLVSYDGIISDITTQKQSELMLKESEEKFRILAEKSPNMIFINQKDRIVYVNERCEKIMGYSREEFYADDFDYLSLIDPEHKKQVTELFKKHQKSEEIEPHAYTLITRKQEKIEVIVTTKIIEYKGKNAILGVITDISEQKKAELALKRRVEFERSISILSSRFVSPSNLDAAINESLFDIGTISQASRAYMFKFSEDLSVMKNTHEWCSKGVGSQIENLQNLPSKLFPWWMKNLQKGNIIYIKDVSDLTKEANAERNILEEQHIKSVIALPVNVGGKLFGFIGFDNIIKPDVWSDEDINLLKMFSEILGNAFHRIEAEETLRLSDQRNRAILEAVPDMMLVISKDGIIEDIKYSEENNFNFPAEELIGKSLQSAGFTTAQIAYFKNQIESVLSSEKIHTMEIEYDSPQGVQIWEIRMTYLNSNEVLADVRNITHKKKLEEEFIKNDKLESLGVLAGGIAHDFNNLLTAILGNISLAKMYRDSWDKISERLNAAEKASLQARELTQQLLTFSRGGEPIKKVIHIGNLIKEAANFALRGSKEVLKISYKKNLWSAEVDASQISQVIQNLIINADQAMATGGIIRINCENKYYNAEDALPLKQKRYIKITIKDDGSGIPKEHLSKIFDPYFTTKQKGSGLGLATVYSIINKHNGYITVDSELGKGTTFHIYLPASNKSIKRKNNKTVRDYKAHGKILVMDDEEVVRQIAAKMLNKIGFEVDFAHDGKQTIKMYKKSKKINKPYSLILMDLTIAGGMGGKETIKKLISIDQGVKAIVSSGYSNDPIMSNYSRFGFKGVIAKPYKYEELNRVLQELTI